MVDVAVLATTDDVTDQRYTTTGEANTIPVNSVYARVFENAVMSASLNLSPTAPSRVVHASPSCISCLPVKWSCR